VGLTSGIYGPASSALLADIVPDSLRVQAYSAFRLSHNAGFACGVSIGGILATHSVFWLFAGDAMSTTLFGVIAIFWLPHGLRGQTKNAPWRDAFSALRKDYAFQALWMAVLAESLIFTQFGSSYSLHVFRQGLTFDGFGVHLTPESVYGLLLGWNGTLVVLTELAVTSITLRFKARRVMALGYCLLGLGFGLNAWAHTIFALWLAMTIFTIGEMISAPTTSAFISRVAPEHLRGRYMGVLSLAWNTSGIFGPQLGFWLLAFGPNYLWFPIASLGFAAAAIVLWFCRSSEMPEVVQKTVEEPETVSI
jgi:MFS family permease